MRPVLYKPFQNLSLSALSMGCMRLPTLADGGVDHAAVSAMVDEALAGGVNYFDTAWGYHGGESEVALGKALAKHPRDSFYLADKFPGYDLGNMGKTAEIFEEQLRRCGVDYFDFYLFHNVCELNIDAYLDPSYGTLAYLKEQKKAGRIKHLGFSCHGDLAVLKRFLDAYGDDMEFCQLQINYIDWTFQKAKEKVDLLASHGIPVWVMEPLRGGMLSNLPEKYASILASLRPDETQTAVAFRFLQSIPTLTVILSGMSDMAQMKQNIATFSEEKPLSDKEFTALAEMTADMLASTVPCTACRYCTEHCVMELDIPKLIALYNEHAFTGGGFIAPMALASLPEDKKPSACVGCRGCEQVCPQNIKISEIMADFTARLR